LKPVNHIHHQCRLVLGMMLYCKANMPEIEVNMVVAAVTSLSFF